MKRYTSEEKEKIILEFKNQKLALWYSQAELYKL